MGLPSESSFYTCSSGFIPLSQCFDHMQNGHAKVELSEKTANYTHQEIAVLLEEVATFIVTLQSNINDEVTNQLEKKKR